MKLQWSFPHIRRKKPQSACLKGDTSLKNISLKGVAVSEDPESGLCFLAEAQDRNQGPCPQPVL